LIALTKTGAGTQVLSGANTYTGSTTVSQGTLSLAEPYLSDSSTLTIAAGATLNLTHTSSDRVGTLIIAGITQPNGLYGAMGSANPNDTETAAITGTGTIRVGTATTPFDQWALDNGLTGNDALPTADPDHDGIPNLDEFAFGGNPSSGTSFPDRFAKTVDTNNDGVTEFTLTIQVRTGASFTASGSALAASLDGITCRVQGSNGLGTFDAPVSEVDPHFGTGTPRAGYQFKTFRLNPSADTGSRGFLRVTATAP
jgi:autotransporter-associated beta strand protein